MFQLLELRPPFPHEVFYRLQRLLGGQLAEVVLGLLQERGVLGESDRLVMGDDVYFGEHLQNAA